MKTRGYAVVSASRCSPLAPNAFFLIGKNARRRFWRRITTRFHPTAPPRTTACSRARARRRKGRLERIPLVLARLLPLEPGGAGCAHPGRADLSLFPRLEHDARPGRALCVVPPRPRGPHRGQPQGPSLQLDAQPRGPACDDRQSGLGAAEARRRYRPVRDVGPAHAAAARPDDPAERRVRRCRHASHPRRQRPHQLGRDGRRPGRIQAAADPALRRQQTGI